MKVIFCIKTVDWETSATLIGVRVMRIHSGDGQLYLSAAGRAPGSEAPSLTQASCQFHALFRDVTRALFAMPDIIPSTDKTEWEISESSSDRCNIFVE